jgi:hypothetical protein
MTTFCIAFYESYLSTQQTLLASNIAWVDSIDYGEGDGSSLWSPSVAGDRIVALCIKAASHEAKDFRWMSYRILRTLSSLYQSLQSMVRFIDVKGFFYNQVDTGLYITAEKFIYGWLYDPAIFCVNVREPTYRLFATEINTAISNIDNSTRKLVDLEIVLCPRTAAISLNFIAKVFQHPKVFTRYLQYAKPVL